MLGQNTQKQVLAMVALMLLGVIALGVYVWFDEGRRAEAEDNQTVEAAERGARLFARNCRVCHGNLGFGRDGDSSLVGVALNTPANTLAWRLANDSSLEAEQRGAEQGKFAALQLRYSNTIACGRNGTPMPAWSIDEGGSLNFSKIESLTALITTNAGNAWEAAFELAVEEDEIALAGLENLLEEAIAAGDAERIQEAQGRVDGAQDRFARGLPIVLATPSLTQDTCGQRTGGATAAAATSEAPAVDTSGFSADIERGQELYFANGCSVCHGDLGEGALGPVSPARP